MAKSMSNGKPINGNLEQVLLNGELQQPQSRVTRQGAPDNRPTYRQAPLRLKNIIQREIMPTIFPNQFRHSPIEKDEIRLLSIHPGKKGDTMHCLIFKRKLAEVRGRYEALSYTWGLATERADCKIYIQDLHAQPRGDKKVDFKEAAMITGPRRFYVRPNLYAALHHLRKRHTEVNLWVDAICINQGPDGEDEKQHQLAQMAQIYNSAYNVCIWLGGADMRSNSALQLIRRIMDFHALDVLMKNSDSKSQWHDLVEIMKSPWFSRRWIIQEVAMARNASVHCGDDIVHWDDFADAVNLVNDKLEHLRDTPGDYDVFGDVESLSASILVKTISNVCRKTDDGDIYEKRMDMETLVCSLLSFQASITHDNIYSLLAIAKDAAIQPDKKIFQIVPNYKRSTRDLYIAFVKRCIDTSNCLDIICRHWAPPVKDVLSKEVQLPSWVAKLSKSPFGLPGEGRGRQNGENFVGFNAGDVRKRYNASKDTDPTFQITEKEIVASPISTPVLDKPPSVVFPGEAKPDGRVQDAPLVSSPVDPKFERLPPQFRVLHPTRSPSRMEDKEHDEKLSGILRVSGFRLAVVNKHSEVIRGGIIPGDWLKLAGWENTRAQNRVPDRLWRTLVGDRGPEGGVPPGWYQRACLHCLVDSKLVDARGNLTVASYPGRRTAEMTAKFLKRVESVVWNRRFFEAETSEGFGPKLFGLAPEETQLGDEVCILFGCTVPVILRKVNGLPLQTQLYELVGEAYVHGKMDGEAVENRELVEEVTRYFDLQ